MTRSRSITRRTALAASTAVAGCSLLAPRVALADERDGSAASSGVLDFLYIDSANAYVGDAQHVVVRLQGVSDLESATLSLTNACTAETLSCAMSAAANGSMLFSFAVADEGTYEVTRLDYVRAGGAGAVDFTDCDASYRSFTAAFDEAGVSLMSETAGADAPELRVYSDDKSGGMALSGEFEAGAGSDDLAPADDERPEGRSVDLMAADEVVVALDPGHVGKGLNGASGVNGTREQDCTWKIAQYCREELERYQGVSVVYTLTPDSAVSGNELQFRVNSAVAQGADVLVSLHLNAAGKPNNYAYGAEVYVPYDASYNSSTHAVGEALAKRIIAELEGLGLYNRGVKIRTINNNPNYSYENGDDGDYYGVIRYARQQNLPAIIVEHAFLDNQSDYDRFLSSDAKLRQLGQADARGIIAYFGLTNEPSNEVKMYRLYNPNSGEHFYTGSSSERDNLTAVGWRYECVGWVSPKTSQTPVYRLYNPNAGDHHYTTSASERDQLKGLGWVYEGIGWYSDDAKAKPVYRQYNPNAVAGAHNFTTSASERDTLIKVGWRDEGTAWYALDGSSDSVDLNNEYHGLSSRTPIMGATTISSERMVSYYRGTGAAYPSDVYAQYGAPTIDDFCRILVEEANGEGVRAEVLFAQVSVETGNLRFGGQVKVGQCNFGGLGATDGGASGADFSGYGADGVRTGLRAQSQHLKAYASKDALNGICVDPRFSLVTRGVAPMVENLGSGKWATDKTYASKLLRVMNAL